MKERKTRKLVCNVTGRALFAGKEYYQKKVEKAGSEEDLHRSYICMEAKQLLKKGYDVKYITQTLGVEPDFKQQLSESELREIVSTNDPNLKIRLNNCDNNQLGVIKTDPDVKEFIKNVLNDGS